MPTVKNLVKAKKKLRSVKKPTGNQPKINRNAFVLAQVDPKIQRKKEAKKLIAEMVLRKKQFDNAQKKLKTLK